MENNFKRFDEIKHTPLRVFNRVVLLNNLLSDFGKSTAENYIGVFDTGERKQLYLMQAYIKAKGPDFVRKEVTKGLEVVDSVSVE